MPPTERTGAPAQLALATAAFTACFFAWSLLGPLGPDLQDNLGLSEFELSAMVAVPVLLGSLMRIPLGALTDRYGGRRVFSALLAFTPLPLVALALVHDSLGPLLGFGFLLGFAGASFAIGVPFVSGWYPPERQGFALGVYGMGMGGTVIGGLTAPKLAKAWGLSAPFWLAAAVVAVVGVAFAILARDSARPATSREERPSLFAPLAVFRRAGARALTLFYFLSFGGFVAMFLYLPKLLTGVHDLSKTDAGARAAGFALLAVLARPLGGGSPIASARHGCYAARSSQRRRSPRCSRSPTSTWRPSRPPASPLPSHSASAPAPCSSSWPNGSPARSGP